MDVTVNRPVNLNRHNPLPKDKAIMQSSVRLARILSDRLS